MKPAIGRVLVVVVVVGAAIAPPTHASPATDAIARHSDKDVAALRAQLPGDATLRCTLGAVYAKRNDLSRAHLYLTGCEDAKLPDDIATDVGKLARETLKKVRASDLGQVELVSTPDGLVVELDALPDERITTPATVWIKAGTYTAKVTANGRILTTVVEARPFTRTPIIFDARVAPVTSPTNQKVDFTDEPGGNATGEQHKGPPPAIKHTPLIKGKWVGETEASGPTIDDPLAGGRRPRGSSRGWSLGARIGGGMFDDPSADARAGLALAAVGRFELPTALHLFVDARLDWSRRGGTAMDHAIDAIAASPALGIVLVTTDALAVAMSAGARLDLRLQSTLDTLPVRRAGFGAIVGLDVALAGAPVTAGVRYEQGLTELYAGARDRAMILELGFDWR